MKHNKIKKQKEIYKKYKIDKKEAEEYGVDIKLVQLYRGISEIDWSIKKAHKAFSKVKLIGRDI